MDKQRGKTRSGPTYKGLLLYLLWLPPLALGLLAPRLAAANGAWIEDVYASRLYPVIASAIASLTARVPFSLAELILYALIALVCVTVLTGLAGLIARTVSLPRFLRRLLRLAAATLCLLLLFYATWGLNYYRRPLKDRMGLSVGERTVDELETLCLRLAQEAVELRADLPENERGVFDIPGDIAGNTFPKIIPAYAAAAAREPALSGYVSRAKRVLWSEGLSWLGISGIYIGITAEPNVNVAQPGLYLPHAAAHEMAHQLGVTSEDEAEFAGYLACISSDDPCIRYSSVIFALVTCGNQLAKAAPERYVALFARYSEGMLRDLDDYRAYWAAYEGPVEAAADAVNDGYLKYHGQQDGIKSYGMVVDLLLAYHADEKL